MDGGGSEETGGDNGGGKSGGGPVGDGCGGLGVGLRGGLGGGLGGGESGGGDGGGGLGGGGLQPKHPHKSLDQQILADVLHCDKAHKGEGIHEMTFVLCTKMRAGNRNLTLVGGLGEERAVG